MPDADSGENAWSADPPVSPPHGRGPRFETWRAHPLECRVAERCQIVGGLDLAATVGLLSGRDFWHLEPVVSAGLPAVLITDGPHGVRRQVGAADRPGLGPAEPATCFPTAATLAASWDEDLLVEVGRALGRECRAAGVGVLLGPGLNLKRHPAGGRNFEYLSEDPLLSGRLAAAMTRGIQSEGVGACLKHLAVNNQETFRMTVNAVVDERSLRELYLAGFEIAVREGRPWAVMASYNRLNGTHTGESRWLLNGVLRGEWGFDGVVISDWGATDDRVAALRAGTDVEMPGGPGAHDAELREAVGAGALREAVDRAARRVVALIRRAREAAQADGTVDRDAHHDLARRAAAAGTVLLTNDGTLPLDPPRRMAVIGALATTPRYQGAGSSRITPTRVDTALGALQARLPAGVVDHVAGYDARTGATTRRQVARAAAAADRADIAVVLAGLPPSHEAEGIDRPHLRLPEGHTRVVRAVLETAAARTVVVLCNGAPVEVPWVDRPAAVLEAYLGGQAGGSAIADVLLGRVEPGGRLAESFPVAADDLPADRNFPGQPRQVEYREGLYVGYRFHHTAGVPARFPFGHGLGYTTFRYGAVSCTRDGQQLTVSVEVTNTGDRTGSEVVQVYIRDVESTVHRPDRELAGFAKVRLPPGRTRTVTIPVGRRALAFWDTDAGRWTVESGTFEILVGSSSADIRGTARVEVTGDDGTPAPSARPAGFVADDAAFAAMLGRPVPVPDPARPFTRNSTVADLRRTRLGRVVRTLVISQARRQADAGLAGTAEEATALVERTVDQLPLRALVPLSGGAVPRSVVAGLVDVLNGRWGRLIGGLVDRARAWR